MVQSRRMFLGELSSFGPHGLNVFGTCYGQIFFCHFSMIEVGVIQDRSGDEANKLQVMSTTKLMEIIMFGFLRVTKVKI